MQARWTIVVAALVLAAPAAAQEASVQVAQEEVPSRVMADAGTSEDVQLGVNLTAEGFSCTSEVIAPVNTTAEVTLPSDAPANASVTPTNASKEFPIPAGEYQTQPYQQRANVTLSADIGGGVQENYTATLTLTSTFPGADYSSCIPMTFAPAESGTAEVELKITRDEVPPEPDTDEDDQGNQTDGPGDTTDDTDAGNGSAANDSADEEESGVPVPWQATPLAALFAALVARRFGS